MAKHALRQRRDNVVIQTCMRKRQENTQSFTNCKVYEVASFLIHKGIKEKIRYLQSKLNQLSIHFNITGDKK